MIQRGEFFVNPLADQGRSPDLLASSLLVNYFSTLRIKQKLKVTFVAVET